MRAELNRIAIIGGGPCAMTLAALLADRGRDVTVYAGDKRPGRLVGESLIPGIIPILRRLGVEEEVARIGTHKPGVTFCYGHTDITIDFSIVEGKLPGYAYNVPRPEFDEIIAKRAARSRAKILAETANLEKDERNPGRVLLPAAGPDGRPDLIVDCSGRSRAIARCLDLPATAGTRKDVAYFAHYEDIDMPGLPGQVMIRRLHPSGWCWQIPLRGCVSVGVVIDRAVAREYGKTPEDRLEVIIESDPDLARSSRNRRRISGVPAYTNYQLITRQGHGPGWVLAGDAMGFNDPMLSPGLYLAFRSAEMLADDITGKSPVGFAGYTRKIQKMFVAWRKLVDAFYTGGVPSSHKAGSNLREQYASRVSDRFDRYLKKRITEMTCGFATDSAANQWLLAALLKYGCGDVDRKDFQIF